MYRLISSVNVRNVKKSGPRGIAARRGRVAAGRRVAHALAMIEPGELDDLYPILKPRDWGDDDVLRRSLAEHMERDSDWIPWVSVGWDHPDFVVFARPADVERLGGDEEALHEAALENLRAFEVDHEEMRLPMPQGGEITIDGFGGMFAAEKILDEDFLRAQQKRLGTELIAVGAPRRAMLLITDGAQSPETLAGFEAAVRGQYRRAESPPVTPVVFAVRDGQIVGLLKGDDDPDLSPIVDDLSHRPPDQGRYLHGQPITKPSVGCLWMLVSVVLGILAGVLATFDVPMGGWGPTAGAALIILIYAFRTYGAAARVVLTPDAIHATPNEKLIARDDIEDVEWLDGKLRVHRFDDDPVDMPGRFYADAPQRVDAWLDELPVEED